MPRAVLKPVFVSRIEIRGSSQTLNAFKAKPLSWFYFHWYLLYFIFYHLSEVTHMARKAVKARGQAPYY